MISGGPTAGRKSTLLGEPAETDLRHRSRQTRRLHSLRWASLHSAGGRGGAGTCRAPRATPALCDPGEAAPPGHRRAPLGPMERKAASRRRRRVRGWTSGWAGGWPARAVPGAGGRPTDRRRMPRHARLARGPLPDRRFARRGAEVRRRPITPLCGWSLGARTRSPRVRPHQIVQFLPSFVQHRPKKRHRRHDKHRSLVRSPEGVSPLLRHVCELAGPSSAPPLLAMP